MSGYRSDQYSSPSRQPDSRESHGRQAYMQPFANNQSQMPSNSLDPLDPLNNAQKPRGYPDRDSGWGNRRPRPSGQVVPPPPAEPPRCAAQPPPQPPPMVPAALQASSNYGWDAAAPSWSASPASHQAEGHQRAASHAPGHVGQPSTSMSPPPTDPRRASSLPNRGWDPRAATLVEVPLHAHIISDKEVKLEYALRTIETRLQTQLAHLTPVWELRDTHLLTQLIEEHGKVGKEGTMRPRTMQTAMSHYRIMTECAAAKRAHDITEEKLRTLRNGVQNIVFDICEVEDIHIRMQGHRALLDLSTKDETLLKSNLSALVEVLQNPDDEERQLVRELLFKHLELAKLSEHHSTSFGTCFNLMFRHKSKLELVELVVDYFSSEWGQKIVEMIVGEPEHEAALASNLADTLPLVTKFRILTTIRVLHDLQSIWVGPDDEVSETQKLAARDVAVAVLWNLGWILIAGNNLCALPTGHDCAGADSVQRPLLSSALTEILAPAGPTTSTHLLKDGPKLFSDLRGLVERMTLGRGEEMQFAAAQKLSETKIFLNELEASTLYLFCYLPLDAGAIEEPGAIVHHFSAPQRIVLFRSAANLAARLASASKQSPLELAFPGDAIASDMSKILVRSLLAHVPTNGVAYVRIGEEACSPKIAAARKAYSLLAAEALLTALEYCVACTPSAGGWIEGHFCDRSRVLIGVAREVIEDWRSYPEEVREAAKSVLRLGQGYQRDARRVHAEPVPPTWLIPPPPVPKWTNPLKDTQSTELATSSPKDNGKKRGRDERQPSKSEERRVRGRGAVHAFADDDQDRGTRNEAADTEGISIRGTAERSRPESRQDRSNDEARRYQAEPSSLFDRLDDRRPSDERWGSSSSSSSHHRSRTDDRRDSYSDRSRGWDDESSYHGSRHRDDDTHRWERHRDDDSHRSKRHRDSGYYDYEGRRGHRDKYDSHERYHDRDRDDDGDRRRWRR